MNVLPLYDFKWYKKLLNEINCEVEKSHHLLTLVKNVENRITFLKLGSFECENKICYVTVKIFTDVLNVINLYEAKSKLFGNLEEATFSENYFVIEVFFSKILLEIFKQAQWKLKITVRYDSIQYIKIIPLITNENSILEVIPVDTNIYECTIETEVFCFSENKWNIAKLHSLNIDISYFFESSNYQSTTSCFEKEVLDIVKLYSGTVNSTDFSISSSLQMQLNCNCNDFLALFVNNSFHRVNIETFIEVLKDSNKRITDIQFYINGKSVFIFYHKDTNFLKLSCSHSHSLLLQKLFLPYLTVNVQELKKKLPRIHKMKNSQQVDEILRLCKALRKLWS